jgi:PKD repeat protein
MVTIDIRNSGDQDALNVTVALYDGDDVTGTLIGDHYIDNSSFGSLDVVNMPWMATIGSHDLTLCLDTDDNVTEDSEANNEATLTVVVGGVPDVRLEQGAFLASTNRAGLVTLTADAINGGNATAKGYRMGFYRGDPDSGGSLIGNVNLADIPAGHRTAAQVAFTASSAVYHIYARAEQTDSLDPSGNDQVDRKYWFNPLIEAKAGPDVVAMAGQNLTFNGSASWSVDGAISNYTWDFGDSSTGYGAVVTHNYTNSGTTVRTLTARLTVKDGSGRSDSDPIRVYINPTGSSPPTADAGAAILGRTLETLTFDGSGSTGNITTYIWDFGDGSSSTGSGTTHEYWEDGTYTASLLVVNSQQLAAADTVIVTVTNQAPMVEPIADIETDIGVTHDLLVLAYDADGYIASYLWDFDDGTTSTVRDPSHTWTSDGSHLVTVNVTDNDDAFTVITFHVNITNVVPQVDFTISGTFEEGETLTVDASPTVEPGDDIITYEWDWETDDIYDNTTGPVSYISYDRPGFYNITLRVTDGEGAVNKTKKAFYLEDVAPRASATIKPEGFNKQPKHIAGVVCQVRLRVSTFPGTVG